MKNRYFLRVTGQTGDRVINVSNIDHAEYNSTDPEDPNGFSELMIFFTGSEVRGAFSVIGEEADLAWKALNELVVRAVKVPD